MTNKIPHIIRDSLSHLCEGDEGEVEDAHYWYVYIDKEEEVKAFLLLCGIEGQSFVFRPDDPTVWSYPTIQINIKYLIKYYKKEKTK